MRTSLCLLDLPFSDVCLEKACEVAKNRNKKSAEVWVMADAALVLSCRRDAALYRACLAARWILPVGKEVRVGAAMLGGAMETKAFSGLEMVSALMEKMGGRYFFLGGSRGMARRAAVSASLAVGCVPCPAVGGAPGQFCQNGRENTAVLTRIWECLPDVVVVCLSNAPLWVMENLHRLPPALYLCLPQGAMEEMANGGRSVKEVPFWAQQRFYFLVRRQMRLLRRGVSMGRAHPLPNFK